MVLDREFPPDERVEKEARSLIQAGYEVHLLCFTFGRLSAFGLIKNIHVHRLYLPRQIFKKTSALMLSVPFYSWFWKRHIRKFIADQRIDVLHVHDLPLCGPALAVTRDAGIPVVADMHENYPVLIAESHHSNTRLGRLLIDKQKWYAKEKEWLARADRIVVVADEMRDRLAKIVGSDKKYAVVPNTIDLSDFMNTQEACPGIEEKFKDQFVLLYFGGIDRVRGIETMIGAAQLLKDQISGLKMVIVGSGSILPELKELAAESGVGDVVRFEGWQKPAHWNAYMATAKACVLPHLKSPQTDNSSPTKLFIYMMFGKPVLASNCNSYQKIIEQHECGLVFESGNARDLAEKVLEMYRNPQLMEDMGANAYRAVSEHYNWEKTSQPLIDLYRQLEQELHT